MDGTVIDMAAPDVRRMHDIVKYHMKEAKHDRKNLEVEIYKNGDYFALAWGHPYGAGAIGFSGNTIERSRELW